MKLVLTCTGLAATLAIGLASTADARRAPVDPPVRSVVRTVPPTITPTRRVARTVAPKWEPAAPTTAGARGVTTAALSDVVKTYCGSCHSEKTKKGNLVLATYNVDDAAKNVVVSEKMVRKLRAEMMPPPGSKRPKGDTLLALVETLEKNLDNAGPINPGNRTFQRLNKPEYERVIKDLLGVDVNASDFLPLDTKSANFDNISDVQSLSPALLESYMNAAAAVSRMAVGDLKAPATQAVYKISQYVSQHPWDHVEGTPYGARGGIVFTHTFPADAEYEFRLNIGGGVGTRGENLDISIDGESFATLKYEKGLAPNNSSADHPAGFDYIRSMPLKIKGGQHKVSVSFARRLEGPYEDLVKPHEWSRASDGTASAGTTESPPLTEVAINGPYNATAISESDSRKALFTCHPTAAAQQRICADQILSRVATKAYRRPLQARDKAALMSFYDQAAKSGGKTAFEDGVRNALQVMLTSPYFIFRFESTPASVKAGTDFKISDIDLASRLSFFLWGTIPDSRLLSLAGQNKLSEKLTFNAEVKRMLADPRSEALSTRFAGQWLRLQDLDKVHPDAFFFPDFDQQVANAMQKETELFFADIIKNDKNILDMYTANYTFINERLAKHYGIPGVTGDEFRKVQYPDSTRQGVLGQGSILVQTSLGNRTSPVLRGKWVMEVLIGMPPPPPPPSVPDLEQTKGSDNGRQLTTRERMEIHRADATCKACHQYMDPIGLSLDNFDVTGRLRYRENGALLDTRGTMYDGKEISTPSQLIKSLLSRPIPLERTFTENLMAYALGRRVEDFDQPTVRAIAKDAAVKGNRFSAYVMGVVNSSAFRQKRADA
ncbi:MAG: DUF1592 domain-containing protein, partial [Gemmatimonadaceae bacterium]